MDSWNSPYEKNEVADFVSFCFEKWKLILQIRKVVGWQFKIDFNSKNETSIDLSFGNFKDMDSGIYKF